jgi:hypothetical protein
MKANCPVCQQSIANSQMNIAANVAACPECNEVFTLSSIVSPHHVSQGFDINSPPSGAWFREDWREWRIGATTRSEESLMFVPFVCLWSGMSIGGLYGSQLWNGQFNSQLTLFGIPFLLFSAYLIPMALMRCFGRVEVIVHGSRGTIFTGLWRIGWTQYFDWSEVTRIEEALMDEGRRRMPAKWAVSLVGITRLRFGSLLSDMRRGYIIQGLRVLRQRG